MPEVTVRGLQELDRAFGRFQGDLRKELRAELRRVGEPVAETARGLVQANGLVQSGKLLNSIRLSVRGGSLFIRDTAVRRSPKYPDGYSYPSRMEYGKGGARAFLRPAVEQDTEMVVEALDRMLGRLANDNGF